MMDTTHQRSTDRRSPAAGRSATTFELSSDTAFLAAGTAVIASIVVPRALSGVTDAAWISGLVLIALAVASAAVGVVGLSRRFADGRVRWVAAAGAGVAIVGATGLLAGVGLVHAGVDLVTVAGMSGAAVFQLVALAMATGLAVGFLTVSVAVLPVAPRRPLAYLLLFGGGSLLVPALLTVASIAVGAAVPHWLVLGTVGAIGLDSLAVGVALKRRGATSPE